MIPIEFKGGSHIASLKEYSNPNTEQGQQQNLNNPLGNLANWSAQYYIPITFINDSNNPNAKVQYTLEGNGYFIIQYVDVNTGEIKVVSNKDESNSTNNFWDFTDELSERKDIFSFVGTDKDISFTYQFILGTNSAENVKHIFRLK